MSAETLIQRAQVELLTLYKNLSDLAVLARTLTDPRAADAADTSLAQMRSTLEKLKTRIEEQDREQMQLRGLFNIGRAINSTLDLDALLDLVMDMIVSVTGAERAFLMLIDDATQQMTVKAARGIDRTAIMASDFQISRSIVEQVARDREPVLTTNAQADPRFQRQQSVITFSLRSILCVPLRAKDKTIGVIYADNRVKAGLFSARDRDVLTAFAHQAAVALENGRLFAETNKRLRELTLLQEVSRVIASTLDREVVLEKICAEGLRTIGNANKVVIHLLDPTGAELVARAMAHQPGWNLKPRNLMRGQGIAWRAMQERRTINVHETRAEPRFVDTGTGLRSLVVTPLISGGRVLGALSADSLHPNAFDDSAERLLRALADQAAIAIENARLFDELRHNIAEVSALKGFQDNVFASIPSGVITTDMQDVITTFNRAAEQILCVSAAEVVGKPFSAALSFMRHAEWPRLLDAVKQSDEPIIAYETQPHIPQRGAVSLSISLSTLRDASAATKLGVAIVVDDLTEQKKLQAREEMFGRYLAPSVIKRLPSDPRQLKLGGQRQAVSLLFADIQGYSTFSERIAPEALVDILNEYLSLAAQAILAEEGTLDKFMGDAVMAFWNAPEEQADHARRAVRAAWHMRSAILQYQHSVPLDQRLDFRVGLHSGEVVVGNIGTERALNYTVVGDVVNVAKRLQESAEVNQLVLSDALYEQVRDAVEVVPLEAIQVKGRSTLEKRWVLVGVKR